MKLSIKQVVASVAGATIAALALSFLGVGGTIVGVAVGSAAATVISALAFHSLERGHAKVLEIVTPQGGAPHAAGAEPNPGPVAGPQVAPPAFDPLRSPWSTSGPAISAAPPGVAATTAADRRLPIVVVILLVFALTLGLLTTLELVLGRPISSALTGSTPPVARTSVGDVIRGGATTTTTSTTRPTTSTSRPNTSTTTSTTTPASTTTSSTTTPTSSTTTAPPG